eukprot:2246244-Rhodomonas_salina.1
MGVRLVLTREYDHIGMRVCLVLFQECARTSLTHGFAMPDLIVAIAPGKLLLVLTWPYPNSRAPTAYSPRAGASQPRLLARSVASVDRCRPILLPVLVARPYPFLSLPGTGAERCLRTSRHLYAHCCTSPMRVVLMPACYQLMQRHALYQELSLLIEDLEEALLELSDYRPVSYTHLRAHETEADL